MKIAPKTLKTELFRDEKMSALGFFLIIPTKNYVSRNDGVSIQ